MTLLHESITPPIDRDRVGSLERGLAVMEILAAHPAGTTLTEIARTTVTQLPVGVLDTSSNGWRDLGVTTAGGGELTGRRKLKHDGTGYPTNPTVPPAEELDILDVQILIDQGDLIALD